MPDSGISRVVLFAVVAAVPIVLVTLTSFLKISVVLALLRNAFGAPGVPPAAATTGLAIVLSILVMSPVAAEMAAAARPALAPGADAAAVATAAAAAAEPLRVFLDRHAGARDRAVFADVARRLGSRRPGPAALPPGEHDLAVVAPAFVTSELREAFLIGLLLLLPFLVVDFVVASALAALGLHGVAPTTVALPLKLVLFVAADGWLLVSRGLLLGYA